MGIERNDAPVTRARKRQTYKTSRWILEAGGKVGLRCPMLVDCSNLTLSHESD
ncbi:MAG: hypothetical protein IKN32_10220 [Bacteroidales bacterium]|nr:hypothetical protein [Bacteroidales bacterium]